jgi:iron complex outermembrane receptor protein
VARWGGDLGDWETTLTAQYRADDGFDKVNDHKRITDLRFRGDHQVNPVDSLSIQLGLSRGEVGGDGQDTGDPDDDPFRGRDIVSHYQHLTWNREAANGSRQRLSFFHHYYDTDDDFALDVAFLGLPPGTTLPLAWHTATEERYDVEFQHNLSPRDNWRLAWGLGGRYDTFSSDRLLGERGEVEKYSGRVFGSLEWRPVDDLVLSLDALTEMHETYGTEASGRIGINWLAADSRSFRANVSRNHRVYPLLERYVDYPLIASDGTDLGKAFATEVHDEFKPERVVGYELGYTERWNDIGLYLDLRLFREDLDDVGVELIRRGAPLIWRDGGGGWTTKGFDVQLDYRPNAETRIVAGYSRANTDGRVESRLDASGAVSEYDVIDDAVPYNTFSALLSHQFDPRWSGSLAVYHVDDMRWRGEGSEVEGYTRVDLKLSHEFPFAHGRGQVDLIVHDLTNEQYHEFRTPELSSRSGNLFDRRAYLQLSLDFD